MTRSGLVVIALLLLALSPATAAYFWPWHQQYRHHRSHHRHYAHHDRTRQSDQAVAPDCAKINAAAKGMSPERYERALQAMSPAEQRIVAACTVRPW